MNDDVLTRRGFLVLLPGVLLAMSGRRAWASWAHVDPRVRSDPGMLSAVSAVAPGQSKHPSPRPGIDASKVTQARDIHGGPEVREAFELVRQVPQVVDGLRCHCGCAEMEGFYSLLSCFEKDGMAQHCDVCQSLARLAHRMHRAGKSLAQIRAAVDAWPG